jgi:hypothetical protein
VTKKAGESGSVIGFDASSRLDRHEWFQQTYPDSAWTPKVRDHQRHVEKQREEKAKEKRASDNNKKPDPADKA